MRGNNRKSIASIGELPQLTTMNVIDGQAGIVRYSSLIFYSLTIDNILNIIVLLILAGVSIGMLTGDNGILTQASQAKEKTEVASVKEEVELSMESYAIKYYTEEITLYQHFVEDLKLDETKIMNYESAKAIAFWYKDYLFVVDEKEMKIECMAGGIVAKNNDAILYNDLLDDGNYVLNVKKNTQWVGRFWLEEIYNNNIKSVVIDNGVTSIEATCNGLVALEKVYLPETLITIGIQTFLGCSNLENITLPKSLTRIGNNAFLGCTKLEEIKLPDSLEKIEERIFEGCASLKSIVLPQKVIEIPRRLFYACSSLEMVSLPDGISTIGEYAFFGSFSLKKIYIPKSVIEIGEHGISNNYTLKKIYYGGTKEEWNNIEISDNNNEIIFATKYYYAETQPTEEGNYWHWLNGQIVEW